jgi:glycosyltransferase involved in cell wall biosynthesis
MKDLVLIANYWHFEGEKASSRYRSFSNLLARKYNLEVVTSTFCHLKKKQRDEAALDLDKLPYTVTLIYEKGYPKNICLKRIISYRQFGKNVYKYLKNRNKPDLIIVSVPSLTVADYITKYANKNNIPVIVDIQDLWPEAFKMALSVPVISDLLFLPMKLQANRIYSRADEIMAVSDTYAERGVRCNKHCKGLSIYIGTDSELVKNKTNEIIVEKDKDEFWVGYIGALGHSYDIKKVIDALKILEEEGIQNIIFKVMGEGVLRSEFEDYAKSKGVKCDFTGLLEYGLMMKTLMACNVAVNPIVSKSVSSIINKVSDYAAAGVPVVNTQNSEEYRRLLNAYDAGINVESDNSIELAAAIRKFYDNPALKEIMGKNAIKMYQQKFDRQYIYPKLLDRIEELLNTLNY